MEQRLAMCVGQLEYRKSDFITCARRVASWVFFQPPKFCFYPYKKIVLQSQEMSAIGSDFAVLLAW